MMVSASAVGLSRAAFDPLDPDFSLHPMEPPHSVTSGFVTKFKFLWFTPVMNV